jgi:NTE family protein
MKTSLEITPCSPPGNAVVPPRAIRAYLAEDLPLLMALLARMLSKDKRVAIVGSATDGHKALRNASTLGPDLVVTDLHMPGLDGEEVTRRLKQGPNPPIVFIVTSDDTTEARARCMAAGADAFLVKAADLLPQLLFTIQEFFPDDLEPQDPGSKHLHAEGRTTAVLQPMLFFLAGLLLLSGCAHYPVNAPLTAVKPAAGYRFETAVTQTNSDDTSLVLAFSGGGTRAAALSYGVLQELAKTEVGTPGHEHRLLDDVRMVSAVSGGSITAAYYTLWGDRIFSDYESRFLKRHAQTGLFLRLVEPWNLARLASPRYDSSDLAASYYDHLLFKGATFADLTPRPGRPFLIVNATDLAIGARFEFTQDQFDLLSSDLSQFKISRAVAASAAFPLFFAPVVLKNYSADHPTPEPEFIQSVLSNPTASSRLKDLALQERSYVDGDRRKYIHLVDGGIADNLGLRGPVERAIKLEEAGTLPQAPVKIPRRLAIIIVDASAERDYGWDLKDRTLGLETVMRSVAQISGNRYSYETIELFREVSARLDREREAARAQTGDSQSAEIESYIVELHFSQLAGESDRRFFNSVPTSLQLPSKTVDRLCQLAARQLADNVEFRRLVSGLRDQPIKSDSPARPSVAAAKKATQMTNPRAPQI